MSEIISDMKMLKEKDYEDLYKDVQKLKKLHNKLLINSISNDDEDNALFNIIRFLDELEWELLD